MHFLSLPLGVPSDRIRIGYCLYHIRIRIQHSNTNMDTNISGCEKMISASIKIRNGYGLDISGSDADTNLICKNEYG